MKLKELPYAVSLTAPRKAFLLLQRIGEEEKENPPKQCSTTTTAATTAKHTQRERDCEMRAHEAKERLFILSQPRVPTESGVKIEPIVVNL